MKNMDNKSGFTLIELLVVVAIIGLLSSVVLSSLNGARINAKDARRISDLKQIQTALELYFNTYGYYPKRVGASTTGTACAGNASAGTAAWCALVTDLAPFIPSIPGDPNGPQVVYRYYYDSNPGDNFQTYGMMIRFESRGNYSKAAGDGGFYNSNGVYYEVGQQPMYCKNKYAGAGGNWWPGNPRVCSGGN